MPLRTPVNFPPLRIQGIVLRESQPSVMINSKIYFIGDEIGGARVVAIDRESVTLELAGQTNVLTLRKWIRQTFNLALRSQTRRKLHECKPVTSR